MTNDKEIKSKSPCRTITITMVSMLVLGLGMCSTNPKSGIDIRYGLCESNFRLAQESRLPKWIQLPAGLDHKDVLVEFAYFLPAAKVMATDKRTGEIFYAYHSADKKIHKLTEERMNATSGHFPCPSYKVITINGIEEILEHAEPGNVVHIVESSQVSNDIYNNITMKNRCKTERIELD
jgi:hypothetical protein